jgi:hypothetical protein
MHRRDDDGDTTRVYENSGTVVTEKRNGHGPDVDREEDRTVVLSEARERFGGVSISGSFIGMLTALAMTFLLGGLAAAIIGAVGYETGVETNGEELTIAGLIAGVAVLFLSFLIGGWTAGRIARYNGATNGAMTVVWLLVLGAVLAAAGAWIAAEYNVLDNANVPNWFGRWFTDDQVTLGAIVSGLVAMALAFLGAILGGAMGERYHRKADRYIADRMVDERDGTLRENSLREEREYRTAR